MARTASKPGSSSIRPDADRRRHPRYAVHYDALFYNQEHFAEIIDISRSGVACRCLVESDVFSNVLTSIDLLDCNAGQYVTGVSCKRVRRAIPRQIPKSENYHTKECYFEFVDLSREQQDDIDTFIQSCSREQKPKEIFQ